MRARLRHLLARVGLTGRLLVVGGGLLAAGLALTVGSAHYLAARGIRDEMRKTQIERVRQWILGQSQPILVVDGWRLAEAIEDLGRGPYVLYAGYFDHRGQSIAHTGDERAYQRGSTLDLLVAVRDAAEPGASPPAGGTAPLPGLVADPVPGEGSVQLRERWAAVLEDSGRRTEDLRGFVAITLDTGPLDRLASGVLRPLSWLAGVLFLAGILVLWALARSVVEPLTMLRRNVLKVAAGNLDVPFHEIPRPAGEVGDLATQVSIMTGRLRRRRDEAEAAAGAAAARLTEARRCVADLLEAVGRLEGAQEPERAAARDALRRLADAVGLVGQAAAGPGDD